MRVTALFFILLCCSISYTTAQNDYLVATSPSQEISSSKEELFIKLKSKREGVLENGILFEGDKLIKCRTQDLADAMAVFMMLQNGVEKTHWFYSNGVVEEVNATKMTQIYQSIGNFRSSQFMKESQLEAQVNVSETLENLDSIIW